MLDVEVNGLGSQFIENVEKLEITINKGNLDPSD